MTESVVERWTDGVPDGIVFQGSLKECQRFVELERELISLSADDCPLIVDFEIDGKMVA
jgi:hypothetical protein